MSLTAPVLGRLTLVKLVAASNMYLILVTASVLGRLTLVRLVASENMPCILVTAPVSGRLTLVRLVAGATLLERPLTVRAWLVITY